MDVRERNFQLLEEAGVTRSDHGIVSNGARFIEKYLTAQGLTIVPAVPGPSEADPNIMELCFRNGEQNIKEKIIARLMEYKTQVKGACHAHVVEIIRMVEEL